MNFVVQGFYGVHDSLKLNSNMITKNYNITQMFSILIQYQSTAYIVITANIRFPETSVCISRNKDSRAI